MLKKSVLLVTIFAMLMSSAAWAAPAPRKALSLPVNGTFTDAVGGVGTFNGTFKLMEFAAVSETELVARGYVVGTLTDSLGNAIGSVAAPATFPVETDSIGTASRERIAASAVRTMATCPILHLDLAPISLNLLGLTVNLSQVVLDIAAESGAGALLGNLLCAVVGLLDGIGGAGVLANIADLLNRILDVLSGILG